MMKRKKIFQYLFLGALVVLFVFLFSLIVPAVIQNFKALEERQQSLFELSTADSALIDKSHLDKISDIKVINIKGKTPFVSCVYDERYLLFIKHIPLKGDMKGVTIRNLIDIVPHEKRRSDFVTYHDIQNYLYVYHIKAGEDTKSSRIFTYISADSLNTFEKGDSVLSISAVTKSASYSTELEGPIEFSVERQGTSTKNFTINIVIIRKTSEVVFIGAIAKDLHMNVDPGFLSRIIK